MSGGAIIWGEIVTEQQVLGYGVALMGLGYYNYMVRVFVRNSGVEYF